MDRKSGHHFPRFHVRPSTGFVNDPNGPIILGEEVHLYFQYRSATSGQGPVSWGHASSSDFVHWRIHQLALTPEPGGLDLDGAWSGSTVLNAGKVVAFYAAYDATARYQSIVTASSDDGGYHFGRRRRVLPDPDPSEGVATFRDPYVWYDGGLWHMVVGAGDEHETASARLYESDDLISWSRGAPMAAMQRRLTEAGDTGGMWECPQVVTLDGSDILIVSPWSPGTELMPVLTLSGLGDNGTRTIGRLDHGANFYAASVLRDSPFGPLAWGWATEGRSLDWCVETDWSGMLTLPRALSIRDDGTIASSPLPVMSQLRNESLGVVRDSAGSLVASILPAQAEVRLQLSSQRSSRPLRARFRFSVEEYLDITVDWSSGSVTIDRSRASTDTRARHDSVSFREPNCASDTQLTMTAYLDGSILELFTNSGRCATVRFYPTALPPWALEVQGCLETDGVCVWSLEPMTREDVVSLPLQAR